MIAIYYVIMTVMQFLPVHGIPIDELDSPISRSIPEKTKSITQLVLSTRHPLVPRYTEQYGFGVPARSASPTSIRYSESNDDYNQLNSYPQNNEQRNNGQQNEYQQDQYQQKNYQQGDNRQSSNQQSSNQQSINQPSSDQLSNHQQSSNQPGNYQQSSNQPGNYHQINNQQSNYQQIIKQQCNYQQISNQPSNYQQSSDQQSQKVPSYPVESSIDNSAVSTSNTLPTSMPSPGSGSDEEGVEAQKVEDSRGDGKSVQGKSPSVIEPSASSSTSTVSLKGEPGYSRGRAQSGDEQGNVQTHKHTEFTPPWNYDNISCYSWSTMVDGPTRWDETNANYTWNLFNDMLDSNKLVCEECYGNLSAQCSNENCTVGLRDLANASGVIRLDKGLGSFTGFSTDLNCEIQGSSNCVAPPACDSVHGPYGMALFQSFTSVHTYLNNMYSAMGDAHRYCSDQAKMFASLFAPAKNLKHEATWDSLGFVLGGVVAGLLTAGIGFRLIGPAVTMGRAVRVMSQQTLAGAAEGLGLGVGSTIVLNDLIFDQPAEPNVESIIGKIVNSSESALIQAAHQLMTDGKYVYSESKGSPTQTITLEKFIENGSALFYSTNSTEDMINKYKRFIFQQLAVHVWKNLASEADGEAHYPFIAFDPKPCDQVDPKDPGSLEKIIKNVTESDTGITYEGTCYYLLDIKEERQIHGKGYSFRNCTTGRANHCGTNSELKDNSHTFDLRIDDFIIPAVEGWRQNNKTNHLEKETIIQKPIEDPREAGIVKLPVCDYLGHPDMPGAHCPRIGEIKGEDTDKPGCPIWDASFAENLPGDFQEGQCKVHVQQWDKRQEDDNFLDSFQLAVRITDAVNRPVGFANKQAAT